MANKRPSKAEPARAEKATAVDGAKAPQRAPEDPKVAQIQRLIDLMVEKGAVEVEMEEKGSKLRVRLKDDRPSPGIVHYAAAPHAATHASHMAPPAGAAPGADGTAEGDVFLSPMVGTFYRAPSPEAEPFVQVGDKVAADGSLCIIEAMKVMNEIKAEFAAQVTAILVDNGMPVEFGQPLFRLKRA